MKTIVTRRALLPELSRAADDYEPPRHHIYGRNLP